MGKKKNNKRPTGSNHPQKRRKVGRYWVEDCIELLPPPDKEASIVVTISRVELDDEHSHRPTDEKKKTTDHAESATLTKGAEDLAKSIVGTETKDPERCDTTSPQLQAAAPLVDIPIDQAFIAIQRDPTAKVPFKKFKHQNFKPLPNGDCGDGVVNPHDKRNVPDKYWAQRKRFFSRFDDGIRLDNEGWYSVTPEAIANHIANRVLLAAAAIAGKPQQQHGKSMVVMDAFCGCGGNAIAFARRPEVSLVIAIDCDRGKLEIAANNAAVYNVAPEKIVFIHGNAADALRQYKDGKLGIGKKASGVSCDVEVAVEIDHGFKVGGMDLLPDCLDSIFLSPPWGGMDYEKSGKRNYHIETCIEVSDANGVPCNGEDILVASAAATAGPVVYFLPRNINGISFGRSALKANYRAVEMELNVLMDKLKTVTAYLGM